MNAQETELQKKMESFKMPSVASTSSILSFLPLTAIEINLQNITSAWLLLHNIS